MAKPWTGSAIARTVRLRDGRQGELVLDLVASELRVDLGGGHWLRLSGSVSPDTLVRVARTRQFTGAIRAQTPEEIAAKLASQSLPGLEGTPAAPDGTS